MGMIKDKIRFKWFNGWSYIKNCTEICNGQKWQGMEDQQFNIRTFCDETIRKVPVLRIIAKNDFVIPYRRINPKYFKYFKRVLITQRGGHCGVHACNETINTIKTWNHHIVNGLPL